MDSPIDTSNALLPILPPILDCVATAVVSGEDLSTIAEELSNMSSEEEEFFIGTI